ncbi:hypothetical protein MTR_5g021560 [Medicago truncatula]|uniref:Uncharacterized protein n=1 Tax=Medicago truncatula TaxID=3880 RepID=G7KGE1_MEDTR|nr:hypothetical protein MTR_5g021560 [Medicago truncatula]
MPPKRQETAHPPPLEVEATTVSTRKLSLLKYSDQVFSDDLALLQRGYGRTNAKQKKVQEPMPKSDESAGTNDTFKPFSP